MKPHVIPTDVKDGIQKLLWARTEIFGEEV